MRKETGTATEPKKERRLFVKHVANRPKLIKKTYKFRPEIAAFIDKQSDKCRVPQVKFIEACVTVAGKGLRFTLTATHDGQP